MGKLGQKNANAEAVALAQMWGRLFGHAGASDFKRTIGIMKSILAGDEEKGIAAYSQHEISRCITWLDEADAHDDAVNVSSPGVIRWVIQDFLDGKRVQDTFLVNGKKGRMVKII